MRRGGRTPPISRHVPMRRSLRRFACCSIFAGRYRFRLHIVHLATAQAVEMLRAAKAEGLPVTVETCPHYLHLSRRSRSPMEPPSSSALRPSAARRTERSCGSALAAGGIDLVATDHSPCPPAMKRTEDGRFNVAWGGIASLSTALSCYVDRGVCTGLCFARHCSMDERRALRLSLACDIKLAPVEPGRDANFVIFDPEAEFIVTEDVLHYQAQRYRPTWASTCAAWCGKRCCAAKRSIATVTFRRRQHRPRIPPRRRAGTRQRMYADALPRRLDELHRRMECDDRRRPRARPCCPVADRSAWALGVASRRPLSTLPQILTASDAAWWSLAETGLA